LGNVGFGHGTKKCIGEEITQVALCSQFDLYCLNHTTTTDVTSSASVPPNEARVKPRYSQQLHYFVQCFSQVFHVSVVVF
jgi:hypothetical protein